jgi:hypothetical protein
MARLQIPCLVATLVLALSCAPGTGPEPADSASDTGAVQELTLPRALGEWTAERPPETFVGDELYMYINGGAEIYHEYGFDRVTVCDYQLGADKVTVEVYTMAGSAYGIYTYSRSAQGEAIALGNGGTLADYYLTFWSGPHLVVVTAQSPGVQARDKVLGIAEALAGSIPQSGVVPALMDQLPVAQRLPGSEHYLRGRIAMRNLAPQVPPLFSGYDEAAAALYAEDRAAPTLRMVLVWPDEAMAEAAMNEATGHAAGIADAELEQSASEELRLLFATGKILVAERTGSQIQLVISEMAGEGEGST